MTRWSRRKLKRQQVEADIEPAARVTEAAPAEAQASLAANRPAPPWSDVDFDGFDFSALSFESDFTRFMGKDVPEDVRSRALKHLWTSSDIISRPDDLDDYLEDFSEEAMALPAELAKSAYEVGRGFVAGEAETSPPPVTAGDTASTSSAPAVDLHDAPRGSP